MYGRCRAGKIVDFVNLNIQRKGHIMADYLEIGVFQEMDNILLVPCEIIIQTDNLMPIR